MNKTFRWGAGFMASMMLLAGISASAGKKSVCTGIWTFDSLASDTTHVGPSAPVNENSVIDEVIWVVGDEPILKSDVEVMRMQAEQEGVKWNGNPDCLIPEQLAVQKLYLHQAALDSIEVTEADISQGIDRQINNWIQMIGSKEKLEEYRKQTVTQMRQALHDDFKNQQLIDRMKQKLIGDVTVTPSDVRNYFKDVPQDSLPFIPTEVEVEILTNAPRLPQEEINRVKDELRNFTDRVNKGEISFAALARLYSEDPGSARQGGEIGYTVRSSLDPAFANVAFNLTDPQKISKIVESEFGFHIIQLIDKRGEKIDVRHILLKPHVDQESIDKTIARLDSIGSDIRDKKFSFEEAAGVLSDDKDTRLNHGLMVFKDLETQVRTSKFRMRDLPSEVARVVDTMKVNQISAPFSMINSKGKTVCAIVKLKSRVEGHRATITEDYQAMKDVVLSHRRMEVLRKWVNDKIKSTYVKMNDRYKDCKFEYQGWIK